MYADDRISDINAHLKQISLITLVAGRFSHIEILTACL